MADKEKHQPSEKAAAFLAEVQNGKYKREIVTGLSKFLDDKVPEGMRGFYADGELDALVALRGTDQDVESRMP